MKRFYCISFILVFCFICTGCFFLWCELDGETASLPNVTFTISPETDEYAVGDEMILTFSQIPDFSFFGKYSFEVDLKEYDITQKQNISTNKIYFSNMDSESVITSINFSFKEEDLDDPTKVSKTFRVKAVEPGKFVCHIYGNGYHFYNNGGYTLVGYDNWIYIDVIE